ncbi:hypothetical protein [Pseudoalteromonas sp.]|uniref:hypothetical protein n=1 Tax=Pseudoalteromonas sp. TaxID=53249 RepID=UPI00257FE396|nr:hypothetical protein [Pseudoalteromonas sp.]
MDKPKTEKVGVLRLIDVFKLDVTTTKVERASGFYIRKNKIANLAKFRCNEYIISAEQCREAYITSYAD